MIEPALDALDAVRPGDPIPTLPEPWTCGFTWFDHNDDPASDPPWRCSRQAGHPGQHLAASNRSVHVAAVHPSTPDRESYKPDGAFGTP